MKKIINKRRILDVIDENEYHRRVSYNKENKNIMAEDTAIEKNDYVYPINNQFTKEVPGVYDAGPVLVYTRPNESNNDSGYNPKNIIDFNNVSSLKQSIEIQNKLDKAERSVLVTPDNIYIPLSKENDTPEMKLFKEAVTRKKIDIDSYKQRFGAGFNNDKRSFNDSSITFFKLKRIADILDMDITLTIKDKPGAPNPIGESLSTIITRNNSNDEDE